MIKVEKSEYFVNTVVVGGGQAGLATGYYLKAQDQDFIILDAEEKIGAVWRDRWESLRLFTPATLSSLPGMPLTYPGGYFLSKDETADYLEKYANEFSLPVRFGLRVDSLERDGERYLLSVGNKRYVANNVVVATGSYHSPQLPVLARRLDPTIEQIHSSEYRSPGQVPEGDTLVVGAGNSGAEISLELAATHHVFLSGRDTGNIPGGVHGKKLPMSSLMLWRLGHKLLGFLTTDTKLGRKGREFSRTKGVPLVRFSPEDLLRAGVERVPRVEGIADGKPLLMDGRSLNIASVVWATGFKPDFAWIDLPIFGDDGYPLQNRGVVEAAPGLYFVGLPFQHTAFSETIGGVGKDARYVVNHLTRIERNADFFRFASDRF